MPKKRELTPRQQRALSKIGLMPFTSIDAISRRFEIPKGQIETIDRENPQRNHTKLRVIERFKKDPRTAEWLNHPKLWAVARIQALAPTHSVPEIQAQLKQEAVQQNERRSRYKVPSQNTIEDVIRTRGLRSPDDLTHIRQKSHQKKRPNTLADAQRNRLRVIAYEVLQNTRFRETTSVPAQAIRDTIYDFLHREAEFFEPRGASGEKLGQNWTKFIQGRMKFFVVDALRKIGPHNKYGTLRSTIQTNMNPEEPTQRKNRMGFTGLRFHTKLAPVEKEVLALLQAGKTEKEIARLRGKYISAISRTIRRIREKAIKE
ncbi:MAG: hypothetical protein Q7R47_04115 [Candidatus Diapherotrites archaeon]|nr:hypothetical protein [Candidatus Diapherotrites archaeon]